MKRYKLIKTYPGSPELGHIVIFKDSEQWFAHFLPELRDDDDLHSIGNKEVLKYSEFWEDISNPVLFKTEEGFNVRKGGNCFFIDTESYTIYSSNNTCIRPPDKFPVFLYKQNAEKWIIFNTPCLSLNQIAQIYITANRPDLNKPLQQSTRIYNLVKQKLNIK